MTNNTNSASRFIKIHRRVIVLIVLAVSSLCLLAVGVYSMFRPETDTRLKIGLFATLSLLSVLAYFAMRGTPFATPKMLLRVGSALLVGIAGVLDNVGLPAIGIGLFITGVVLAAISSFAFRRTRTRTGNGSERKEVSSSSTRADR